MQDELFVNLKNDNRIKTVKLYDSNNKLILNTTLNVITTFHLAYGVYVVNIITDKGSYNRKLIKE